ncbi:venom allergen 3-like [Prorops nasuta]|uniref:venom allergen 3-like n=1 Tax=Prorops nasuta TaxID=863751 RepID=UPI0034D00D8D
MRRISNQSFYFYLFAAIFVGTEAYTDYCDQKCIGTNALHTMCLNYASYGTNCHKIIRRGLKPDEISVLLKKHNQLRAFVASGQELRGSPGPQPAAAHMPELIWDNEIARVAQVWADQCSYGHDECRDVKRFQVGQNIYEMMSDYREKADLSWFVQDWYDEVTLFNNSKVENFSGDDLENIGHYTQMVWGKTKRLGCGIIEYMSSDNWWIIIKKNTNVIYYTNRSTNHLSTLYQFMAKVWCNEIKTINAAKICSSDVFQENVMHQEKLLVTKTAFTEV